MKTKTIKITNDKRRDASVNFETRSKERQVAFVLPDGSAPRNVRVLKSTLEQQLSALVDKYGSLEDVAEEIINDDPEIDLEKCGWLLETTKRLYLTKDNEILYGVDLYEITSNPDGSEKGRSLYTKSQSNINIEKPIQWSGKFFPKSRAIKMFIFSRKYQLKHVNGLTYDFLYEMAKLLHQKKSLMLIGTGRKGQRPLIFHAGGIPYRGFLEGRIKGDTYCLILHLTNLEMKELTS